MRSILKLSTLRVCVFSIAIISSGYCSAGAVGNLGAVILCFVYGGAQAQMNITTVNSTSTIVPYSTNSTNSTNSTSANMNLTGMPTQAPTDAAGSSISNPLLILGVTGATLIAVDQTPIGWGVNYAAESVGSALMATGSAFKSAGNEMYQMVADADG